MTEQLSGVAVWGPVNSWRVALSATWPDILEPTDGWNDPYTLFDAGTLPFLHPMFKHTTFDGRQTFGGRQIVDEILRGDWNEAIDAYLDSIVAYCNTGRKAVLVPYPEMNGIWVNYGPVKSKSLSQNYANARTIYREFVNRARAKGLTKDKVLFCWAPNDVGWGKFSPYWPGDEYVDVIGGSAYNRGDVYEWYAPWETPKQALGSYVSEVRKLSQKPIVITQTGSGEADTRTPGWLSDLVEYTKRYEIEGFIWFSISEYTYTPGAADFNSRVASLDSAPPLHWFQEQETEIPTEEDDDMDWPIVTRGAGMTGRESEQFLVGMLQGGLKGKGFRDSKTTSSDGVDMKFGSGTERALNMFKASVGLPQDGVFDGHTWRKLIGA